LCLAVYGLSVSGFRFPGWSLIGIALAAGLLDSFFGLMLYFVSVKRISAHEASSLSNTAPFWGVTTSVVVLGEAPQPILFVAALLVVVGSYLLMMRRDESGGSRWGWGAVPALGAGIVWGFAETVPARYCLTHGMTPLTFQLVFLISVAIAWGSSALLRIRRQPLSFPRRGVLLALVTGLLGYVVGWLLWLSGLSLAPASLLSPVRGSMTLFAFLFSVILLRERPTRRAATGVLLTFAGVLLVTFFGTVGGG